MLSLPVGQHLSQNIHRQPNILSQSAHSQPKKSQDQQLQSSLTCDVHLSISSGIVGASKEEKKSLITQTLRSRSRWSSLNMSVLERGEPYLESLSMNALTFLTSSMHSESKSTTQWKFPSPKCPTIGAKPKTGKNDMLISISLPAQSHGEVFHCLQLPLVTRLYWNEAMKIAVTNVPNNGG